jgi:cell wall-associated NlpC family hydrolase
MTAPIPLWVDSYIGRAFRFGADGPNPIDCYGLLRTVLREQFGAEVPPFNRSESLDATAHLALLRADPTCPWVPAAAAAPGDVVAFDEPRPDGTHGLHVGIVLSPGWMIHAHPDGVGVARYDRGVRAMLRIGPVYRHRDLMVAPVPA